MAREKTLNDDGKSASAADSKVDEIVGDITQSSKSHDSRQDSAESRNQADGNDDDAGTPPEFTHDDKE